MTFKSMSTRTSFEKPTQRDHISLRLTQLLCAAVVYEKNKSGELRLHFHDAQCMPDLMPRRGTSAPKARSK